MALKRTTRQPSKSGAHGRFTMPRTVGHAVLLDNGSDEAFRQMLYLMVLAFGRLTTCREAFGRAMGLTGSQFTVLIGTAYTQDQKGVSIRALAEHVQLAATHVTTEVGRLIRKGLLLKRADTRDRRAVLVRLSRRGELALLEAAPFVRGTNDLLFQDISRSDFEAVSDFLHRFAGNTERALAEIRGRDETAGRSTQRRQRDWTGNSSRNSIRKNRGRTGERNVNG